MYKSFAPLETYWGYDPDAGYNLYGFSIWGLHVYVSTKGKQ